MPVVHVGSLILLVGGNPVKVCGCIMGRAELIGQFSLDGGPRKYCISGGNDEGRWDGRNAWASSSPMALNCARSRWALPVIRSDRPPDS